MTFKQISLLFVVVLLAARLPAQNISGSITGTVRDPAGAVIPRAKILLSDTDRGLSLSTESNAEGIYVFPTVLPGTYRIRVEASGFKMQERVNVKLASSEVRGENFVLQLGEVRETVTVEASGTPVQLASSEKSGLITGEQIHNLAIKGRDFLALVSILPGVVDLRTQREAVSPDAIRNIHIMGGRPNQKNLTVDGITNLDTGSNETIHFEPNMDAIAEVKILTSNYQAEYGRNSAGVISVITRGGTRDFHGTGYYFYRHESLNANSFWNNRTRTPKPVYRYQIGGYNVAGPVYIPGKFNRNRDKLFFFWSQEYTRQKVNYGTQLRTTPTERERAGDFSQTFDVNGRLTLVRDPLSGQNFAGNLIPRERINARGQAILNYLPKPNYVDPDPARVFQSNHRSQYSGGYPKRQDLIRADYNLSDTFQISGRWVGDTDEQDTPYGIWVNGGRNYFLTPTRFGQPGKGWVISGVKTFSPTLVNEVRVGYSHNNLYYDLVDQNVATRDKVGNLPQWYPDKFKTDYAPNFEFGGVQNSPNASLGNIPYVNYNNIYSVVDNLSKVIGKHSLKFGFYVERTVKFQVGGGNYRGHFSFARDANNPSDANHAFANALLGNFQWYQEASARVDLNNYFSNFEWYVQDNWKLTPRFTLDLGLRFYALPPQYDSNFTSATWDPRLYDPKKAPTLFVPGRDASGRRVAVDPLTGRTHSAALIGLFVPGTGDPANGMGIGGKNSYPRGFYENSKSVYLGPRLGFAYDVFGNGKLALRGGFGLFFDRPQGNPAHAMNGQPPVAYTPRLWYSHLDAYTGSGGVLGPSNTNVMYGEQPLARIMNFSFGVQRDLGFGTVMDASYAGSLGRHLIYRRNINAIPMFARFHPRNADPTTGSPLNDNFLRPYPGYGDLTTYEFNGTSNYHSFQLGVTRRYSRNLQYGLAYTWSKVLGATNSDYDSVSPYFPVKVRNYGPLSHDRSHVLAINFMWDVPGLGKAVNKKWLGVITDDWQVSGILSFLSGGPFTPGHSTVDSIDLTGSNEGARITVIGNPKLSKGEKSFDLNFNTAAFARTPRGSFGNASVGILRGPGVNNWDLSLYKRIPLGLGEGRFLQFRAEFYNAWNHTQFSGIDAGARFNQAGEQVNPSFGAYNGSRDPRRIQLALKLYF